MEYVTKGLTSGSLKPIIDRTFKFDEMVEVHRYLENSGQFGKIVVTLRADGFYRHFYSKGQLVAEAYATGMECVEE